MTSSVIAIQKSYDWHGFLCTNLWGNIFFAFFLFLVEGFLNKREYYGADWPNLLLQNTNWDETLNMRKNPNGEEEEKIMNQIVTKHKLWYETKCYEMQLKTKHKLLWNTNWDQTQYKRKPKCDETKIVTIHKLWRKKSLNVSKHILWHNNCLKKSQNEEKTNCDQTQIVRTYKLWWNKT